VDECNKRTKVGDIFGTRWIEIRRIQNLKVLTTQRQIPSTWTTPASSRLEFLDGTGLAVSCKWKTPASDNTTATTRYKAHHGRFKLTMKERMKE